MLFLWIMSTERGESETVGFNTRKMDSLSEVEAAVYSRAAVRRGAFTVSHVPWKPVFPIEWFHCYLQSALLWSTNSSEMPNAPQVKVNPV